MRPLAFIAVVALVASALPALAPTAAAGCVITKPLTCLEDICVFSFYNDPGCIVPNPCDPRFCDIWFPDPSILDPIFPILP